MKNSTLIDADIAVQPMAGPLMSDLSMSGLSMSLCPSMSDVLVATATSGWRRDEATTGELSLGVLSFGVVVASSASGVGNATLGNGRYGHTAVVSGNDADSRHASATATTAKSAFIAPTPAAKRGAPPRGNRNLIT